MKWPRATGFLSASALRLEMPTTASKKPNKLCVSNRAGCGRVRARAHSHIGCEDAVDKVLLGQVEGALQLVVVEGDLPGARAVEPRLHERGPSVLQEKSPADVILADPRHAGIHRLAAVVLHCILPQEEEGEEADVVGRDKVGLYGGEEGDHYIYSCSTEIFAAFIL